MTRPTPTARALVLVAAGGAAGALARYGVTRTFPVARGTFPTTTLVVNVLGAFVLAVVLETLVRRGTPDHWARLVLGVGLAGGFTTFSTLATELALLVHDGERAIALAYAGASVSLGVPAVLAGLTVAGFRAPPVPAEDES